MDPLYFLAASIVFVSLVLAVIYLYERNRITYLLLTLATEQAKANTTLEALTSQLLNVITANTGAMVSVQKTLDAQNDVIRTCREDKKLCRTEEN